MTLKQFVDELVEDLPYTMAERYRAIARKLEREKVAKRAPITPELVEKLLMQVMTENKKKKGKK